MSLPQWHELDAYFQGSLLGADPVLESVLQANAAAGLPAHDVSPCQGRMLELLARATGAKRILEIGTLGGYSAICLARALPEGGCLVTMEANPRHAAVARANLERAGLSAKVEVLEGQALEILPALREIHAEPFDLVFIDADKGNNPFYFQWAVKLCRKGALILVDNVVREGAVLDGASEDPRTRGVRQLLDLLGRESLVKATAIQTVGVKGWDGFVMAVVTGN